jgi:hypothetical protein
MSVVQIGVMRMPVNQRSVVVHMGMFHPRMHRRMMVMLVVFVMVVAMLVYHRFMRMIVPMPFREMEPQTQSHQAPGNQQQHRQWFPEYHDSENRPDEWRA